MNLIVCVDESSGIMFNNRRVSKDKNVINMIKEIVKNQIIVCSEYSSELFDDTFNKRIINSNLDNIKECEYYFLENLGLSDNVKPDKIFIFNWNREYPSDIKFNFNCDEYRKVDSIDFRGNSHDIINMCIYERN